MASPLINAEDETLGVSNGFRYVVPEEQHYPAIIEHLKAFFFRDEPLMRSVGASDALYKGFVNFVQDGFSENRSVSLLAFCEITGKLAGVRLSKLLPKGEETSLKEVNTGPGSGKIVQLVKDIYTAGGDLFDKFGVDVIQEFKLVSVDKDFRKRGLATQLILRSMRLAKKQGVNACKGIFTNTYSQNIARNLGLQIQSEFLYKDYRQDKEVVFTNMYPHVSVKMMARLM